MCETALIQNNFRFQKIEEALLVGVVRKAFLEKVAEELNFDIWAEFQ